jgi:hypothetical protein
MGATAKPDLRRKSPIHFAIGHGHRRKLAEKRKLNVRRIAAELRRFT